MGNNEEMFRRAFATKMNGIVDQEQYQSIMSAFDEVVHDYNIECKNMDMILVTDIPEIVKIYIASKHIENLSMKTLLQYKYKLINFFRAVQKPFDKIDATDVRLYLNHYKQTNNVSNCTLEHTRICINTFFEWLVINDYLKKNPIAKVEHIKYRYKKRESLTPYELETLRWNCKNIREKALVDFIFSTGMRVSECSDVKMDDIDWMKRSVIIRHGKGDKERIVFFNAESELTLRKYIESRDDNREYLFVSRRRPYNKLSPRSIEIIIKQIGERCGIEAFPHKLRHTFATTGLRGGMPIERIQALMGHVNPQTTLIYAKLDFTDLQREHQRVYTG